MKSLETLKKSYVKQKQIFDEAEQRRINNLTKQIQDIDKKISNLEKAKADLTNRLNSRKEFEDFDSFRLKIEKQRQQSQN